jgi:hypothetical protein
VPDKLLSAPGVAEIAPDVSAEEVLSAEVSSDPPDQQGPFAHMDEDEIWTEISAVEYKAVRPRRRDKLARKKKPE